MIPQLAGDLDVAQVQASMLQGMDQCPAHRQLAPIPGRNALSLQVLKCQVFQYTAGGLQSIGQTPSQVGFGQAVRTELGIAVTARWSTSGHFPNPVAF